MKDKRKKSLLGKELGRYRLVEVIGEGGMSTVYLADQISVNRQVAVKVLPSALMHDETFMVRFRREAKTVAALEHLHILPVYDYGEEDNIPYIVTRYLDGGSVRDLLNVGPLPWKQMIAILRQVADALDHAHEAGVIHRDIKPNNILLDSKGNAFLADFGIAKVEEGTAAITGSKLIGTPAYMAPEQAEGMKPTPLIDLYALGCLTYEMISGEVPYTGDNAIAQAYAHISEITPQLHMKFPTIPKSVSDVVLRSMAKKPGARYPSAQEFVADLAQAAKEAKGWQWTEDDIEDPTIDFGSAKDLVDKTPAGIGPVRDRGAGKLLPLQLQHIPNTAIWAGGGALALVIVLIIILVFSSNGQAENPEESIPPLPTVSDNQETLSHGPIVYETSFATGWQPLTTERARSYGGEDGYNIVVGSDWAFWAFSNVVDEADMFIEAFIEPVDCQGQMTAYGIVFHYRNSNHFRRFTLTCGNRYAVIDRNLPEYETAQTVLEGDLPDTVDASTGVHTLGARLIGNDVIIYVDGVEIDSGRLPETGVSGDVGPYVETGSFDFEVVYTGLSVYSVE